MTNTDSRTEQLSAILARRIMVLDGAMGTMIQRYRLDEAAFRGDAFADHPSDLRGANDLLCLTQPAIIEEIHSAYLEAGADIVETNTFNATAVSLSDYHLENHVYEINRAAAGIARRSVDAFTARDPGRPRFVAGAMGPTNRTASLSPDVANPAFRAVTFDQLAAAYYEQARGLVDGGVDILLPETSFDTLNLKAAIFAIETLFAKRNARLPVMLSVTITDASGRTLSGQTVEAFWNSVAHANALSVGINCALGAREMRAHVEELSRLTPLFVSCYPNAGLPNALGGYDETPDSMAAAVSEFAANGWVNVVGGCCGTTPDHIRALADAVRKHEPRVPARPERHTRLSGLEPLTIRPDSNFIMIGERTNVTGSPRFAKLVKAGDLEGALTIAKQQIEGGANILDVNMDEGLLDSENVMAQFLNLIGSEPDIARIPIMIDSSRWTVLESGLKCLQGKSVVNSISLKEGEDVFREHASLVHRYGAAVVVMAFDEDGQAVTVERKVAILARAYRILTEEVGFDPTDVIFDPNVLTVATGMEEHNDYAVTFIEATRALKARFPLAKVSGGISNISFSFRGNNGVREAMHAAFLYHAIAAGLDMGIVNAGQLAIYEEIPKDLLERVEDVLLNRRQDATERLLEFAATYRAEAKAEEREELWRQAPVEERLAHALINGIVDHLEEDLAEARTRHATALSIIEGPLMDGMKVVGDRFGAGKMFLPQVVKSARVMKKAVAWLMPYMEAEKSAGARQSAGRVLLATVKGDVHDIGKNIVGVVLGCNSYEVIDLGVMVPADRVLDAAVEHDADIIGLSGLITPSLDEMAHVAAEMRRRGMKTPLLIGGATTSRLHTAIRIAPAYSGIVAHVLDASRCVGAVSDLLSAERRAEFARANRADQEKLAAAYEARAGEQPLLPIEEARRRRTAFAWDAPSAEPPPFTGVRDADVALEDIVPFIDWTPFFHAWELKGRYPAIFDDARVGARARELHSDARALLDRIVAEKLLHPRAVYGLFAANAEGDDVLLYEEPGRGTLLATLHMLRQQVDKGSAQANHSLADYVAPRSSGLVDHVGAFAVTSGSDLDDLVVEFEREHDDYSRIMAKALADRLAEALAEWLHREVRMQWGFGRGEVLTHEDLVLERYRGIRPAPGYPACPDHSEKSTLFRILDAERRAGIRLTENFAMWPASSVSGWYFAHPDARYFSVGKVGRDQVFDYHLRKDVTLATVERWLAPNLGYRPEKSETDGCPCGRAHANAASPASSLPR